MASRLSHWSASVSMLVVGGLAEYVTWSTWQLAVVLGVAGLLMAWWVSPLRGGATVPEAEARRRAASDGAVVIYWRPGCAFCARLRRSAR
jgi:hypothetical protein